MAGKWHVHKGVRFQQWTKSFRIQGMSETVYVPNKTERQLVDLAKTIIDAIDHGLKHPQGEPGLRPEWATPPTGPEAIRATEDRMRAEMVERHSREVENTFMHGVDLATHVHSGFNSTCVAITREEIDQDPPTGIPTSKKARLMRLHGTKKAKVGS